MLASACGDTRDIELRRDLIAANNAYTSGNFAEAEAGYEAVLEKDPGLGRATYNQGNAQYRQDSLGKASENYRSAAADGFTPEEKAWPQHNTGNALLTVAQALEQNPPQAEAEGQESPDPQQYVRASIEAYKEALRNTPEDEDTRYNLALAQSMLKDGGSDQNDEEQQQEQQDKDEENKEDQEKKDEGEEEQDQDGEKNEDEGEDGDEQKDEQGQDGEQDEEKEGKEGENGEPKEGMSKQEAEQLLDALDKNEKDLQEKMSREQRQGKPIKIDKDW